MCSYLTNTDNKKEMCTLRLIGVWQCAECVCVFDVFFCIPFCVTLLLSVCLRVPDICNKWILWLNKEQNITVHFIRRIVLVCLCYSTSSNIGGLCLTQPHKQRVETLNWYGMAWHGMTSQSILAQRIFISSLMLYDTAILSIFGQRMKWCDRLHGYQNKKSCICIFLYLETNCVFFTSNVSHLSVVCYDF